MTRRQFVYSTLAAGTVFTVAAATPKLYHESSPSTSPTFAIRTEKRSFLGIQRLATLDFTGVDFQNGL